MRVRERPPYFRARLQSDSPRSPLRAPRGDWARQARMACPCPARGEAESPEGDEKSRAWDGVPNHYSTTTTTRGKAGRCTLCMRLYAARCASSVQNPSVAPPPPPVDKVAPPPKTQLRNLPSGIRSFLGLLRLIGQGASLRQESYTPNPEVKDLQLGECSPGIGQLLVKSD